MPNPAPHTWATGETIDATKLNALEAAAAAAATTSDLDAASTADRARANHTGTQPASTITGLAAVATSGSYTDLTNKPTIPAAYTDEQAQDAIGAAIAAGTQSGISVTYNDAANSLSFAATGTTSPDASTTSKGIVQLAGDLGGTAAAPTVPGLASKAPLASPTFTGTVSGITKAMVGLGSVDNTADTAKPVSTAQQTAIDTASTADRARANHTGTQSADTLTDGTTNKAFLATERTKLTGIATGATANATDAQLRDRSTHTGTQAATTITGLATVATTGAYTDLTGKPAIPAVTAGTTAGQIPVWDGDSYEPQTPAEVTAADIGAMSVGLDGYGDILDAGETTIPRRNVVNAAVGFSASGTMRFTFFRARRTGTVSSVVLQSGSVAAATPTLIRIGLYAEDASGNLTLVGSTTNDTTLFASTFTSYTKTLSTPWTGKVANSRYALGILVLAGTTPTLYGVPGSPSGGLPYSEMFRSPKFQANLTGQTDLPSSVPVGSLVANSGGIHYAALLA